MQPEDFRFNKKSGNKNLLKTKGEEIFKWVKSFRIVMT